jgi:hypothetical protein
VAHARLGLHLRGTPATSQRLESFSSFGSVASPDLDPLFKTFTLQHSREPARTIPQNSTACTRFSMIRRQMMQRFADPRFYYSRNYNTIN